MSRYVSISEAAKTLGVSITTLRRWEVESTLKPDRTAGRQRRYDLTKLRPELFHTVPQDRKTLAYVRVSNSCTKEELDQATQFIELYCSQQGWTFEVVTDLGSGVNYNRKGLKYLLNEIIGGKVGRLVISHKDSLLRLGSELIFAICEAKNVEVLIINNKCNNMNFDEDLANDILEIANSFNTIKGTINEQ